MITIADSLQIMLCLVADCTVKCSVFKLILNNHTHGLESDLVFAYSMSESCIKAGKIFDTSIEGFMPGSCLDLMVIKWCCASNVSLGNCK